MPFGIGEGISGYFQYRGQRQATQAEERMTNRAIEEQRRNQELERRRLSTMWDDWYNQRRQLMAMYGLDVPEASNPFVANMPESYPGGSEFRNPGSNLGNLASPPRTPNEWA